MVIAVCWLGQGYLVASCYTMAWALGIRRRAMAPADVVVDRPTADAPSLVEVGTDCSGMEAPIAALRTTLKHRTRR